MTSHFHVFSYAEAAVVTRNTRQQQQGPVQRTNNQRTNGDEEQVGGGADETDLSEELSFPNSSWNADGNQR